MEMTKERLEMYRSNRDEIKELKYKLDHLGEGDSLIGNDVIFDYRKDIRCHRQLLDMITSLEQNVVNGIRLRL